MLDQTLLAPIRSYDWHHAGAQRRVRRLQRTPGGRGAGRVRVEREHDVVHVPPQQSQVTFGDRRPERGHHVAVAVLMGHGSVHVALDDHGLSLLRHRPTRKVQGEQCLLLVKQQRVACVEVLRPGGIV